MNMPRGMGSPERAMFDPTKKAENKASFAAMNEQLGIKPQAVEAKGRWGPVDRNKDKAPEPAEADQDEIPTDSGLEENESPETTAEQEADALLDQWVDYLVDPENKLDEPMMSESGKVLVDVQKLYDLGLNEKSLRDIQQKARQNYGKVARKAA